METIVSNLSQRAQRRTLHNRSFLVASGTLIVPGVLPGTQGPGLYPAEIVNKDPSVWDGMPIVVRHPVNAEGKPCSARRPEIVDSQGIGTVYNTKGGEKLASELWFDEALTLAHDAKLEAQYRIMPRLLEGRPIEVSTGLYRQYDEAPDGSVHNGKPYTWVLKGLTPDHLAVLPDQLGACSVKDGCGVHNSAETPESWLQRVYRWMTLKGFAANQLSHDGLRGKLYSLLRERFGGAAYAGTDGPSIWISDVFDKFLVYERDGALYRINYKTDLRTETVELVGEPEEVVRSTTYKSVTNTNEDRTMATKKENVDFLVANCDCTEAALNALPDGDLQKLRDKLTANAVAPLPPVAKPLTDEEWMKAAPAGVRSVLQNAIRVEQSERDRLVDILIANVADGRKQAVRDLLAKKDLADLQLQVELMPKPQQPIDAFPTVLNFSGASGGPPPVDNQLDQDDVLPEVSEAYEQQRA